MKVDLAAIQKSLGEAGCDGWLFYDHHRRDPIAYEVLKLDVGMCTRRWYYLIPAAGDPVKLVHRIEAGHLDSLPGKKFEYAGWKEQRELLGRILAGHKKIAMQYSPQNDIPYIGLVDCGTVELIRGLGTEVVSSADLVQLFEARWPPAALASHEEAGKVIHAVMNRAFRTIRESIRNSPTLTEYDLQQQILRWFAEEELETAEPPAVAVNANTGNPHYCPAAKGSAPIRQGDFVLLDVWGKKKRPGSVYFDITWTGYVGESVPEKFTQIFNIVRQARDAAVEFIQRGVRESRAIHGWEVDDVARKVITEQGYGKYFVHRTGHSIGREVHGNGANMDNLETRDGRRIIPHTCFSIEPGIYLPEFGVRSEVNVYIEEGHARVTGPAQEAIVAIL